MTYRHTAAVVSILAVLAAPRVIVVMAAQQPSKPAAQKPAPAKPVETAEEHDQPIALAKVPQAVRTTLNQYAKDSEIKTATKGDADGTAVYEFTIEQGTRKLEVSITPKGEFFGSEEEIALTDVPEAARATITKLGTGATIVSIERAEDRKHTVSYEAVVDKAGKKTEYAVSAAGKVIGTEKVGGTLLRP
jgi:uncharacterized membrane protein YkoI